MPRPKIDRAASPKRKAILDASLELFAERGYHGTTMPEVAERARVGAGTLYRYFDTKEALVNELYRYWKTEFARSVLVDLEVKYDAREFFGDLWARMWRFYKARPTVVRFLELHHHGDYLDRDSRRLEDAVLAPLQTFMDSAQRLGKIGGHPIPLTIALVHGAFLGLVNAEARKQLSLTPAALREAEQQVWKLIG